MKTGYKKIFNYRYLKILIKKIKNRIWSLIRLLFISSVSYIIFHPLLIKLSTSLKTEADLYDPTVQWIPRNLTFTHYIEVFEHMNFPQALFNSIFLTIIISLFQLIACTWIGYGFARYKVKESNILFAFVIFVLIVPPQMLMIPLYLNFRYFNLFGLSSISLNLLGTYWPGILMAITGVGFRNGLFIYIMRQYFKGMPRILEEAAYVDGAGPIKTFYKIMLPGAIPALVVVFLFAFVWQWNDYFFTVIFMGGENLLTNNLANLVTNMSLTIAEQQGPYRSIVENTGSILFITPLLLLYTFLQKYFIESVERTGIVG